MTLLLPKMSYKFGLPIFKKGISKFDLEEEEKEEIIVMIFGENGKRKESLIGSESIKTFSQRLNVLNEHLIQYKHPKKEMNLSDWFIKYKFRKLYNNVWKVMKKHWAMVQDYYTTNDIEGFYI